MALIIKDRVKETTTTSGTIPFVAGGAIQEFQSFSSAIGDANTTLYAAEEVGGTNWEVGVGQYVLSNNSLLRTTILASSNNNNIVNFPAGSKNLFVTVPAAYTALTGRDLSQFASTTSANLLSIITDETGSGQLVFSNNAVLANSTLGTANGTTLYLTNDLRAGNVYSNGQIVLTSEPVGQLAFNQANTRTFTFFQNTAPTSANNRDQWIHSDTGFMYENFGTPASPVWAEVGPTGLLSNTSPGVVSATQITSSYTPQTATGAGIQVSAANTQGGGGYADFLKITNSSGGATNPNKWFRLDTAGTLQIINSAYNTNIFNLTDAGSLNVPIGPIQVGGNTAVNGPAFSAYIDAGIAAQSITSGSLQKVSFTLEEYDTNNNFASSRFTPTVAGYYQLNATVRFDSGTGTGEQMIVLYKNGAEYKRGWNASGVQWASSWWSMSVSSTAYANGTSDYFEIYVQQGSGVALTLTRGAAISWFNGCMIRGA